MTTHDFVYQTFIVYIFLKASILLPVAWVAFVYSRSEKRLSLQDISTQLKMDVPANDDQIQAAKVA